MVCVVPYNVKHMEEMIAGVSANPIEVFLSNIERKSLNGSFFVQFNFNSEFYNYVEFRKYTRFVTSAT